MCSDEVEVPPAKARWCLIMSWWPCVAMKLKYYRLKRGGVYSGMFPCCRLEDFRFLCKAEPGKFVFLPTALYDARHATPTTQ
jgi:hypothetical protein